VGRTKLVLVLVFAALFVIDLCLVVSGRTGAFDERFLSLIFGIRDPFLTVVFRVVTFCGNSLTMIVICVFIIILPGRTKVGLPAALMTTVGWAAQTFLKNLVERPRPDPADWLIELAEDELFQSFPSGHANASMILWAALAIIIGRVLISKNKRGAAVLLRAVFIVFAVLIGLSRLYIGVHYPSDVFGGWMLAGLILTLCFALYDRLWPAKWRC
jgi:undecaprenyl-diphosphatase